MSRIKIDSKQIFESYTDSISEEHEGKIDFIEDGFEIEYAGCYIKFVPNALCIKREQMYLNIELGKINSTIINTPYGEMELTTKGNKISWNREPFCFNVSYAIKFGNTEEYINELQIVVTD